jgi:hypothetical protein
MLCRDYSVNPHFIVRNRFQVICLRQETPKFMLDPGLIFSQPIEFGVHSLLGLGDFSRPIKNESLRRIKHSELGITTCVVTKIDP